VDGEAVWVEGYGKVLLEGEEGIFVAVRSWIDRRDDDQTQVIRLFHYRTNSDGVWHRVRTIKVTQVWNHSCGWVCQR
jgi:hypothetical protein